jgi:succinate-semialdehyde dehydrogenase/glutarate-semialdehyde dehydrogenase
VVNLVYGVPAEISEYLIQHPVIQKISFTGSTPVGKHLASLAGRHMKRSTMDFGGHASVLVFDRADIDRAIQVTVAAKYKNAGQVRVSPTRFLVQDEVFDRFTGGFVGAIQAVKVGNGLDSDTQMGPLANERRIPAIEAMLKDASAKGQYFNWWATNWKCRKFL